MKQIRINQVYNDGKLKVLEKVDFKDEFNTPIQDNVKYSTLNTFWYRNVSVTSNEVYQSLQIDTSISKKVAIRLFDVIGDGVVSKYIIEIDNIKYSIHRIFHNYKRRETEITLVEYIYE